MTVDAKGRLRLSIGQHVEVHKAVHEEYAKSNLGDEEFARMLSKRLGYELTKSHVQTARETYGIPGNGTHGARKAEGVTKNALVRISDLEKIVAALRANVVALLQFKAELDGK